MEANLNDSPKLSLVPEVPYLTLALLVVLVSCYQAYSMTKLATLLLHK